MSSSLGGVRCRVELERQVVKVRRHSTATCQVRLLAEVVWRCFRSSVAARPFGFAGCWITMLANACWGTRYAISWRGSYAVSDGINHEISQGRSGNRVIGRYIGKVSTCHEVDARWSKGQISGAHQAATAPPKSDRHPACHTVRVAFIAPKYARSLPPGGM